MIRFFAPFIVSAVLLGACATAPTYAPATTPNGAGYFERQIEANRYFVTYRAAGEADAQMLQDFALLRAAELTLQQGGDWFWVDRRGLDDAAAPSGPRLGVSVGGGSFGRSSGVGVGLGMSFPLGGGGQRAHSATVEMRIGEGAKPDDPNAFDAHAIAANLRARLAPPP